MSKDPAFLFYPVEFLAECFGLEVTEIGQFLLVLIEQFKYGHLTVFDLSKMANGNEKILSKFCEDENGLFFNKWLQTKIDDRKAYSESRRKNRTGKKTTRDKTSKHMITQNDIEDENEDVNEDSIEDNAGKRFVIPTIEEARAYIKEKKYTDVDPIKWWNFYNSKDWYIGKNKMKNWHSAIATWHKEPPKKPVQKYFDAEAYQQKLLDEQRAIDEQREPDLF